MKHYCPNVPVILVGNKIDLRNDERAKEEVNHHEKGATVKSDEGRVMADKIGAFAYLECSARTKDGVRDVFEAATRAALQPKKKKRGGNCNVL